jgi:hypothetical protein
LKGAKAVVNPYCPSCLGAGVQVVACEAGVRTAPCPVCTRRARYLPGGTLRYVHVSADRLRARLERGEKLPLVAVRLAARPGLAAHYRRVEVVGPSAVAELEAALPGTNVRGIFVVLTESPLVAYRDSQEE